MGGAGRNVMTTTGAIMGASPTTDRNLVSASVAGSTVTLTFSGAFSMGIAHATIGTFTAPQFAGTPDANAAKCTGTQSIKYKTVSGAANSIVWTPPIQKGSATSVTLSFAGASGYGTISRHTITLALSNAPGTTATPILTSPNPSSTGAPPVTQYKKITNRNCASNQMDPITNISTCQAAARALQLASKIATTTSATPLPEGCYYAGNQLYLAVNPANIGKGAAPGYEPLCVAKPATAPPTTAPTTSPIPNPGAGQSNGGRYAKISSGTCASNQLTSISDLSTCAAAATSLSLNSLVTPSSAAPAPEGCYYNGNRVWLSTNPANNGYTAAPGYEVLCLVSATSLARFSLVKAGNCASNGMSAITERSACEAAAQVLQLADKIATTTADAPKPEGCFYNTYNNNNDLYLSTNPANAGYGAAPGYELLCLNIGSNVASAASSSIADKLMMGGIVGGALLLCFISICCICRCRGGTKHFEA